MGNWCAQNASHSREGSIRYMSGMSREATPILYSEAHFFALPFC